jgi:hypothetical protein
VTEIQNKKEPGRHQEAKKLDLGCYPRLARWLCITSAFQKAHIRGGAGCVAVF